MGFLEDGRKLIQDLIVPEFKALQTEVKAVREAVEKSDAKHDKTLEALSEIKGDLRVLSNRVDTGQQIVEFERRLRDLEERLRAN